MTEGDLRTVALCEIIASEEAQPRVMMNFDLVREFADDMIRGDEFPPLDVFWDGTDYWLADGFHRFHAAEACQLTAFDCVIRPGDLQDAIWFSLGANRQNGIRRSQEDVRNAVKRAVLHPNGKDESDHFIARYVGCSHMTVGRVRQLLVATGTVSQSQSRVDKNGVERVLPQPRAAAEPREPVQLDIEAAIAARTPMPAHMDRSNDWLFSELSAIARAHAKLPDPATAVASFPIGVGYALSIETAESILDWWAEFVPLWTERYPEFRAFVDAKLQAVQEKLHVGAD